MSPQFANLICSEIQYATPDGNAHSDLDPTAREQLHAALDEWLDKSEGTGYFYVGDLSDLRENFA